MRTETLGVALLAVVFLLTLTQPVERTIAQETRRRAAPRRLELFMVRFLSLRVDSIPSIACLARRRALTCCGEHFPVLGRRRPSCLRDIENRTRRSFASSPPPSVIAESQTQYGDYRTQSVLSYQAPNDFALTYRVAA
jgi:hypothetical protein